MNRADLKKLAIERSTDAKVLLSAKRWSGAYYLAGYAVECGLKACVIVRLRGSDEFPDKRLSEQCWTHNLSQLFGLTGLKPQFDAGGLTNPELLDSWDVVRDWTEASRYARTPKDKAESLFEAVNDKKHGVLPWIKSYW